MSGNKEHWDYDPNKACKWDRGGGVSVEVTLGQWKKRATFKVDIGGNMSGFDVMDSAPEALLDQLVCKDEHAQDGCYEVTLTDHEGNTLLCECWPGENPEDWVKRRIVRVETIGGTGTKAEN